MTSRYVIFTKVILTVIREHMYIIAVWYKVTRLNIDQTLLEARSASVSVIRSARFTRLLDRGSRTPMWNIIVVIAPTIIITNKTIYYKLN